MRASTIAVGLPLLSLLPTTLAASWSVSVNASGEAFFDLFTFSTGRQVATSATRWLGEEDARAAGLAYVDEEGAAVVRTDSTNIYTNGTRPSIRLESKSTYGDGVYILYVGHLPRGCATWPAWWTRPVPASYQEIDIWENTNEMFDHGVSVVHTNDTCTLDNATISARQTGELQTTNCDVRSSGNEGCRTGFESDGDESGVILAMERSFGPTGTGVNVWAWNRDQVPEEVASGADSVDPTTWGLPGAAYPIREYCDDCGMVAQFLVLGLSLCGGWTNSTYASSGCASEEFPTCISMVNGAPSLFNESYWTVNRLTIYTEGGGTDNSNVRIIPDIAAIGGIGSNTSNLGNLSIPGGSSNAVSGSSSDGESDSSSSGSSSNTASSSETSGATSLDLGLSRLMLLTFGIVILVLW